MGLYDLDSTFTFGKYKDRTLKDVSSENAMYIEWCIINVDFFIIDEFTAEQIKKKYPKFLSSEKANQILNKKIKEWDDFVSKKEESANYWANKESSNWNNEYYNDGLDTDQQSPEWWDNL